MEFPIILGIFLTFAYSSDVEFVAHPGDLSVKEGESGSFNCTLKSSLPFSAAKSYWENGLTQPIYQSDMYNVATTADNISRRVSSHLTIYNVRKDMSKLYKCWITLKLETNSSVVASSQFANLDVLYFLESNELQCRGPSGPMLQEYHQITIECEGVKTNPPPSLRWSGPPSPSSPISQTGARLTWNITVTPLLHNSLLICVAESEAFQVQVNCSLGPYTVIHSPIVEVVPHQAEMIYPSIAQIQFQCKARGYPQVKNYKWFCHPPELFAQCTSHSQNVTITIREVETEVSLNISCEATNEVATSRNSSVVNVRYEARLDVCKSNSKYLSGIVENRVPALLYDDKSETLKCLTEVKSIMEEVRFKWYLDGHLVSESNGDHDIIKSAEGSSHLFVYNSLKISRPSIAACNIVDSKYENESLKQVVTCILSTTGEDDPKANVGKSFLSTSRADNESYSIGQRGYSNEILIAVPIASGSGILFSIVLIILMSRKLVVRRRMETHTSGTAAQLSDFESNPSSEQGFTSQDQDGILPVYEIPDADLGRLTSSNKTLIISHFGPGRCINVDRYLQEQGGVEEEESEAEEEEEEEKKEEEEDKIDDSKESYSNSSVENQDISFSSDDTSKNE